MACYHIALERPKPRFIPFWLARKFRDGSREKPFLTIDDCTAIMKSGDVAKWDATTNITMGPR